VKTDTLIEKYTEAIESLGSVVQEVDKHLKNLDYKIEATDKESQDLLHLLEFENFNAAEGYYIAKQLQEARKKRRKYKDNKYLLSEIKKNMNFNSKFDKHVFGMRKAIKDIKTTEVVRTYTPKQRTDLTQRFERIQLKKERS